MVNGGGVLIQTCTARFYATRACAELFRPFMINGFHMYPPKTWEFHYHIAAAIIVDAQRGLLLSYSVSLLVHHHFCCTENV
jgi:hypothetical protein